MEMPKFNNYADLDAYLQNVVAKEMARSADVERIVAEAISQAVVDVVYGSYQPNQYDRRMDEDGLSDPRNIMMTDFFVDSGNVSIIYENLTEGNDSMSGKFIADTIVEGIQGNWNNPNGVWSEPRDFMSEAIESLRQNPSELITAIKSALSAKGFQFK